MRLRIAAWIASLLAIAGLTTGAAARLRAEPLGPEPGDRSAGFFQRRGFHMDLLLRLGGPINLLRVEIPELLSVEGQAFRYAPLYGVPPEAELGPHGYRTEVPGAGVEVDWTLGDREASMRLAVTNRGAQAVRDVHGHVCLQLFGAQDFSTSRRRVWIFREGTPLEFSSLREIDGYPAWRVRVAKEETGDAPAEPAGVRAERAIGSVSSVVADDGVIVVSSRDGRWSLGTLWEDAEDLFHNPQLRCIHSNPFIPEIAPGATAMRRGWIVLVEGGPLEARRKLLERAAGASTKPPEEQR